MGVGPTDGAATPLQTAVSNLLAPAGLSPKSMHGSNLPTPVRGEASYSLKDNPLAA